MNYKKCRIAQILIKKAVTRKIRRKKKSKLNKERPAEQSKTQDKAENLDQSSDTEEKNTEESEVYEKTEDALPKASKANFSDNKENAHKEDLYFVDYGQSEAKTHIGNIISSNRIRTLSGKQDFERLISLYTQQYTSISTNCQEYELQMHKNYNFYKNQYLIEIKKYTETDNQNKKIQLEGVVFDAIQDFAKQEEDKKKDIKLDRESNRCKKQQHINKRDFIYKAKNQHSNAINYEGELETESFSITSLLFNGIKKSAGCEANLLKEITKIFDLNVLHAANLLNIYHAKYGNHIKYLVKNEFGSAATVAKNAFITSNINEINKTLTLVKDILDEAIDNLSALKDIGLNPECSEVGCNETMINLSKDLLNKINDNASDNLQALQDWYSKKLTAIQSNPKKIEAIIKKPKTQIKASIKKAGILTEIQHKKQNQ